MLGWLMSKVQDVWVRRRGYPLPRWLCPPWRVFAQLDGEDHVYSSTRFYWTPWKAWLMARRARREWPTGCVMWHWDAR